MLNLIKLLTTYKLDINTVLEIVKLVAEAKEKLENYFKEYEIHFFNKDKTLTLIYGWEKNGKSLKNIISLEIGLPTTVRIDKITKENAQSEEVKISNEYVLNTYEEFKAFFKEKVESMKKEHQPE